MLGSLSDSSERLFSSSKLKNLLGELEGAVEVLVAVLGELSGSDKPGMATSNSFQQSNSSF